MGLNRSAVWGMWWSLNRDIKVLVGARAIINLCAWIFILSGNDPVDTVRYWSATLRPVNQISVGHVVIDILPHTSKLLVSQAPWSSVKYRSAKNNGLISGIWMTWDNYGSHCLNAHLTVLLWTWGISVSGCRGEQLNWHFLGYLMKRPVAMTRRQTNTQHQRFCPGINSSHRDRALISKAWGGRRVSLTSCGITARLWSINDWSRHLNDSQTVYIL